MKYMFNILETLSRIVEVEDEDIDSAYEKVEEIFKKYSHSVLHNHIGYNIRMELYAARMMAIHDFVEEKAVESRPVR